VGETTIKFLYYGSLLIVFITVLPLIGLDPSGLLLAGGITGIVLGFASQNIVGNLISGVFLMIEKPIKIGDQVEINKISGYVTDIRIISTFIRTFDGLLIRIPNQQVFTTNITNTVSYPVRRFDFTIKIRYSDDADAAIWFIQELIDKEPFALSSPSPYVYVNDLGENSVDLVVRIWAPISEWYGLKTRFLWAIKKVLEENNIEVPFPQREIYLHNVPEKKQIPEKQTLNQGE
jgi:small-conductance mechanosensitive channel